MEESEGHPLEDMLDLQSVSPRASNAMSVQSQTPTTIDSPWLLSPVHPSAKPPILFRCAACLHRRQGYVHCIAVSGGTVFTGSDSNCIRCWRQQDFTERGSIKASSGDVRTLLAHKNILFSSHKDNKIRAWRVVDSENLKVSKLGTLPKRRSVLHLPWASSSQHKDLVSCMAFYEAEGLLYTGSHDKTVKVWRLSDRKCVDTFVAHEAYVSGILVNENDGCVFTCSFDGSVKLWRKVFRENSHSLTITLRFQQSPVNAIAIGSSWGNALLYSGQSDGTINFWEKERFSSRYSHGGSLKGHRLAVQCLVTIDELIFSGSEDTTIRVWRREGRSNYHECLTVIDGHHGPVKSLTVFMEIEKTSTAIFLYSASSDQTLKVWQVNIMSEGKRDNEDGDGSMMKLDHEISPVLSPLWVEQKTKGSNFQLW